MTTPPTFLFAFAFFLSGCAPPQQPTPSVIPIPSNGTTGNAYVSIDGKLYFLVMGKAFPVEIHTNHFFQQAQ